MRNILKKSAAVILALALCLNFVGCYSEDKKWAAKMGDDTMPIGGYIFYLSNAYSDAAEKVSSDTEILKGTIDGQKASDWIKSKALDYLKAYYFISSKFSELGLELSQEDLDSAKSNTSSMWTYYKTNFESIGIAEDSYNQAYTLYNTMYSRVLEKMYSEGGELALSEDVLKEHFTKNYYSYEYFYAPLSKTGADGNSEDLTDDEKSELKTTLEGYVDKINSGEQTTSEAASDYAYASSGSADSSTYSAPSPSVGSSINTDIFTVLSNLEDKHAGFVETSTAYYVVTKLPIEEKFSETMDNESQKLSLLMEMKGEEFSDYVIEQGKKLEGVEINQKAIDSVKISKLVNDNNKNGTSSASSETSSDSSSESSSGVSSETSSEVSSASSEVSSQAESSEA